jgi:hypothetical protein
VSKCVCKECDWQATNGDVCEPCADEGCGKSNQTPYSQGFRAGQAFEQKRIIELLIDLGAVRRDMFRALVAFNTSGTEVIYLPGLETDHNEVKGGN